jgi:hypothetical protein
MLPIVGTVCVRERTIGSVFLNLVLVLCLIRRGRGN